MRDINVAFSDMYHLFLLALLCLGLGLRPLLPHTNQSRLAPHLSQLLVGAALNALRHVALLDLLQSVLQAQPTVDWQDG